MCLLDVGHLLGKRDKSKFLAVSQFEYIKQKNKCHASESWHPEQTKWILEESSTGFRRNDISNETETLSQHCNLDFDAL